MDPQFSDYAAGAAMVAIGAASLAILFWLFQKHISSRPLLEYEPRRSVPWNVFAPLIMLAPLLAVWRTLLAGEPPQDPSPMVVASQAALTTSAAAAPPAASMASAVAINLADEIAEENDGDSLALPIAANALFMLAMAAACYALLAVVCGATREDLGLPTSWRQFGRDVLIGFTACVAAMLPIYVLLIVLNLMFETNEQNPLIQELMVNHSPAMMAAAALAAIVAAPIYEETTFRLVFQGWLEKFTTAKGASPDALATETGDAELSIAEKDDESSSATAAVSSVPALPSPSPGVAPIVITALLFGLAHVGHGWAPVPLVLLGAVMGYLYRQTHRIVPSMACHMLFNSITFVMLELQFGLAS